MRFVVAMICFALVGGNAFAQQKKTTAAPPEPPAAAPAPAAQPQLDFDLFGDAPKAPPSAQDLEKQMRLEEQVKTRRRVLQTHQAFGFITLGVMAVTLVLGHLNFYDKFDKQGEYTGIYNTAHLGLGVSSTALFATTGILALAAPNPFPKPKKADAVLAHKILGGLATAAMVAQIVMGPVSVSREGNLDQRDIATAHLAIGYAAWGLLAGQMLSFVF